MASHLISLQIFQCKNQILFYNAHSTNITYCITDDIHEEISVNSKPDINPLDQQKNI